MSDYDPTAGHILPNPNPLTCGGYYCDVEDGHALHRDCALARQAPPLHTLAADPIARDLLRCLARQPWQEAHWAALRDRAEELGYDGAQIDAWRSTTIMSRICLARAPDCGRRARQRLIRSIRGCLLHEFGWFLEPPF